MLVIEQQALDILHLTGKPQLQHSNIKILVLRS